MSSLSKYICAGCGKEYPNGGKFCTECGGKIVEKQPDPAQAAAQARAEAEAKQAEELAKIKAEAEAAKAELAKVKAEAEAAKAELAKVKAEAEAAKAELAKVKAEAEAAKAREVIAGESDVSSKKYSIFLLLSIVAGWSGANFFYADRIKIAACIFLSSVGAFLLGIIDYCYGGYDPCWRITFFSIAGGIWLLSFVLTLFISKDGKGKKLKQ